jgi:hypothetical protein
MKANTWKDSPGNEDDHYSGQVQPIDLILSQKLGFLDGNIIKYITRRNKKGGVDDLRKAVWYLGALIREEGSQEDLEVAINTLEKFRRKDETKD